MISESLERNHAGENYSYTVCAVLNFVTTSNLEILKLYVIVHEY